MIFDLVKAVAAARAIAASHKLGGCERCRRRPRSGCCLFVEASRRQLLVQAVTSRASRTSLATDVQNADFLCRT